LILYPTVNVELAIRPFNVTVAAEPAHTAATDAVVRVGKVLLTDRFPAGVVKVVEQPVAGVVSKRLVITTAFVSSAAVVTTRVAKVAFPEASETTPATVGCTTPLIL